ncbi:MULTISPECIES: hypothetical protein [Ensifer]|uniref:hypothetical protein n=1 Tax=Ensifer TaxID=106591 RepID=UPI00070F7C93|nr:MULTISPECIES: hypothetical protein [Ensifer]KQW51031.1 hypothetical protein ASD02_32395 [Ensifer sp. Root1252]KRC54280.1 hypothetical protein ASE32_22445 [Ensifer sp. Root231]KRD01614.1 hypothetical protein ASE47_21820 [Ensifer sp. Root258]NOV16977.1 hypothetical protein [Ensifer canadensis]
MPKIAAPKHPKCHPDRSLNCQEVLEAEFQHLAAKAEAAGWSRNEVAEALIELAENNYLAVNAETEMFELGAGVVLIAPKPH